MDKIKDLLPGDQLRLYDEVGIFVCRLPHPRYVGLQQVIWYLPLQGKYSFDALSPTMELQPGTILTPSTHQERVDRLSTFLRPQIEGE